MKNIIKLCFVFIISIFISSCAPSADNGSETSVADAVSSDNGFESFEESAATAANLAGEIFDCFTERDSEKLKSYFSQYIQNECDLDTQIEEAFAFIDGEILSSDNPTGMPSGSAVEDGIWIKRELSGEIENIKTDSGKTYEIKIEYLAIEKKNPDKVGCSRVLILETTPSDEQEKVNKYIIGGVH